MKSRVFKSVAGWGVDTPSGLSGDMSLERAWLTVACEVYELFCGKQGDYGPNNISAAGLRGVAVRLNDKVQRLLQLTEGKEPVNESMRDTLLDIADYGIIATLLLDGAWPKSGTVEEEPRAAAKVRALKALIHERGIAVTISQIKEILYGDDYE